ncbi:MAG: hypothetical protein EOQ89_03625 [Mesorhizobium sp.]|nr:MAG: hypothetical protein EOQ89_03625 [Mesorhizobium sp.]
MRTNITPEHRERFNALTSGQFTNFALFSCFINGKPAVAIVAANQDGDEITLTPLFVSITDDMVLTDHDGVQA